MKKEETEYFYEKRESLVTSTKEFINNILRYIYKKYRKVTILDKIENNILSLKVNGYREYLTGNYQLLQYERVRICLRKCIPL